MITGSKSRRLCRVCTSSSTSTSLLGFYGDDWSLQKAPVLFDETRLFLIAPILETVSRLLKNVRILVEEDVVGKNVLLKGRFEFVLKRGTKRNSLVQAKREDMLQGLVQNVTGLEALVDVEDLSVVYGIVTNFLEWKFLISEDERVRQQECTLPLTDTIPTFKGLKEIVGKIYAMLQ